MREVGTANPRWIVLGVGAALGWTLAKIAVPLLVLEAVERGIDPYDGASLLRWASLVVAVTLVIGALTFARRFSAFRISLYAEAELRRRLFDHLQRLHFGYHDRAEIGELMARVSTDAKQVQMLLVFIPVVGANVVMVVGVSVVLFALDPLLAAASLAALPFLVLAGIRFSVRLGPVTTALQEELAEVSHQVEESISGIRVVKAFGAEDSRREQLGRAAAGVYAEGMAMARLRAAFTPLLEVLPLVGLIAVLYVGGRQVIDGNLNVATLIAFNFYVLQLVFPLRMTAFMIAQLSRGRLRLQLGSTRCSPPTPRSSSVPMPCRSRTRHPAAAPARCGSRASPSATSLVPRCCATSTS